ncbi:MAG: 30S ribosomal protein S15 [Nanohaloarchaea archaeon]|nr:30S ribosomal protein S15 [Candidatus Nanohaloarchaea archaeon]
MSRMHSKGRGSSGSDKPVNKKNPRWVEYDEQEVKDLVVKLRRNGDDPSQIGMKLRDQYGIPSVKQVTDMKITEILEEEGLELEVPEDLKNLLEKAESIQNHVNENPKDEDAQRNLELTEAKIRRIASYHREEGDIPEDWEYERDE